MRSRCSRSIMTMSAPLSPSRMSRATSTPMRSMPGGSSVEGATTRTRAPMALSRMMLDRDQKPLEPAFVAADRQGIEQGLRRMFMLAVAGIDHGAVNLARQQFHRAG